MKTLDKKFMKFKLQQPHEIDCVYVKWFKPKNRLKTMNRFK